MMRKISLIVIDTFLILATYTFTLAIFRLIGMTVHLENALLALLPIIFFKLVLFSLFGFYKMIHAHVGFEDLMKIILVILVTNLLIMGVFYMVDDVIHPLAMVFITPLEITMISLPRVIYRITLYIRHSMIGANQDAKRTLIIGAGDGGDLVLKEIYKHDYLNNNPIAFVDDDEIKIGKTLLGIKIIGPIAKLQEFIEVYRIEEVIIGIANLSPKRLREIIDMIKDHQVKIKRLPLMDEVETKAPKKVKDVEVEDLLERDEIVLDTGGIQDLILKETVLITGGGGTIGSELARQIARFKPKHIIIFDIYENNAYDIQTELESLLRKANLAFKITTLIGSVYDQARVEELFKTYKPGLVFHAAAYKHVPLMEASPKEAIKTNILGTYYVAKAANQHQVKQMILISSDKAVRPTNIMGASKRYAELIVQSFNKTSDTAYASVRFGNVLGSNGSVIPLFKKQILSGGPITVTDKEITRYFMTVSEAVGLILECTLYAKGGEIFILDMGKAIKIKDLAKKMIKLAGLEEGRDIEIVYTGLRPGEKLYEELLVDETTQSKTANQKIFIESNVENGDCIDLPSFLDCIKTCNQTELKQEVAKQIHSYQLTN